jgi:hypothetical protein
MIVVVDDESGYAQAVSKALSGHISEVREKGAAVVRTRPGCGGASLSRTVLHLPTVQEAVLVLEKYGDLIDFLVVDVMLSVDPELGVEADDAGVWLISDVVRTKYASIWDKGCIIVSNRSVGDVINALKKRGMFVNPGDPRVRTKDSTMPFTIEPGALASYIVKTAEVIRSNVPDALIVEAIDYMSMVNPDDDRGDVD